MADEMDESRDAEEKVPSPEETMRGGLDASSTSGEEQGTSAGEAVSPPAEAEESLAATDLADNADSAAGSKVRAESEVRAEEKPPLKATSAEFPETRYEAVPNVEQFHPHAPRAASAGETTKTEGAPRVEVRELDRPGLELLYDVELDATLQFGSKEMLLRDVLELAPGDVVELDRHIAQPVDLVVGDRIVARGEVVVASGNFALRVTEVATPQMRLESIRCLF